MSINSVVNDTVTSESVINALKPLPPTISNYSVGGLDDTALDPAGGQTVQINGTGFLAGATITFDGSAVAVVTYVNPNRLTFTSPAKSAGTYTIYVVNPDGGTAIYIPGIIYSVLPTWTTSAGTLGSYYETTSISNTVVASGDVPITYSLFSGSLPTGSTLYANGVITGTAPVDSSSTTYSFTIQASDAQLQDSTRSFSLTINIDAVTWVSPANATTYTSAVDSAIANVALSATDAAGYAVSYSANALPTGLTLTGSNIAGTPTVVADSSTLLTAMAATTNRTAVRTINWSIIVANDVYFEYNTLLIPGASTTFVDDASTNNFAVTINGDTKPNNFNPYTPGYYSSYFDGSSAIVNRSNNTALAMGTGDFTIEFWMNAPSTSSGIVLYDSRLTTSVSTGGINIYHQSGTLYLYGGAATNVLLVSASITYNQWNHIAFVKSGSSAGNVKMYVNGVLSSTYGSADTSNYSLGYMALGAFYNPSLDNFYTGYLSNFRIVKGTAVYTSNFTPSTTPLTAIANTSLLTCQSNRFIDNSTNNFTITVVGNTSINSFQPFTPNTSYSTYGSGYFDGTGDYLTAPSNAAFAMDTGDFTVESWVFPTAYSGSDYDTIFDFRSSGTQAAFALFYNSSYLLQAYDGPSNTLFGSGTLQRNTWNHVALTRSGTTWTLWLNGVSQGTRTSGNNLGSSQPVYISTAADNPGLTRSLIGYQSNFRVVKGTAVYTTTFTPPSEPLTAIANTSLLTLQNNQSVNNNVFLDNSTNNFLVTRTGNTTQGTFSPYGGNWSNYFDGTGDYLSVPDNAAWNYGTGDFTIEFWVLFSVFPSSTWMVQLSQFVDDNNRVSIFFGNNATSENGLVFKAVVAGTTYRVVENDNANITMSSLGYSTSTWYHVAISRSGSSFKGFINGVQKCSLTSSGTLPDLSAPLVIGAYNTTPLFVQNGYISNLRIIKGTALYTTTFTPSTTPLTPITNTQLLTCLNNRFMDNSTNNFAITKNGDTSVQRFSPFNPSSVTPTSYSGYFDGTGDVLTPPANNVFAFGTDSFCIEAWIFNNVLKNYSCLVTTRPNNSNYADAYHIGWDSVGGVSLYVNSTSTTGAPNGTITTGQWQHFVCCRNSSNITAIFVNGTRVGNDTVTSNFTRNLLGIGDFPTTPAEGINGYISNLRLVKGNSVYDPTQTTITVPTSPLTTTSQGVTASTVSILTCQSTTFIDNSTNNFTITAVGNTQPTQQNPFGFTSATTNGYTVSTIGGSGYFDGTGDYLTTNYTINWSTYGSYTLEFWVYHTAMSTNQLYFAGGTGGTGNTIFYTYADGRVAVGINGTNEIASSSGVIKANTWQHIAYTFNGTTTIVYVDGVQVVSGTTAIYANSSVTLAVGGGSGTSSVLMNGYISNMRFSKSVIYSSAFTPPTSPVTAITNTQVLLNFTSAGVYDAAMMNNMETVGDAKLSTAISKFGGSSMSFDGTTDALFEPSNINYGYGTGDFTIEFWLYLNATTTHTIVSNLTAASGASVAPHIYYVNASGIRYYVNSADRITGSALSTGQWYHIAVSRSGSSTKMFINGTQTGSTYTDTNNYGTSNPLGVGDYAVPLTGVSTLNGYIDDLRITKGYARYTTTFTPPTAAFPIY